MPINPALAIGSALPPIDFAWTESDVMLYHLGLGAGARNTDPKELRYVTEKDLQVLPTFAVVAPTLHETAPPRLDFPGLDIDLRNVLAGEQQVELTRPLTTSGQAIAIRRVTNIWDKGQAAVIELETAVRDLAGVPLWTATSRSFIRNEGGFGGDRGPSGSAGEPPRTPDASLETPTIPQQALLYRLLGDRNPLHSDPESAKASGFPAPLLHGLASYGIICKALVDRFLDADVSSVRSFRARFSGIVFPGETLRTEAWSEGDRIVARATVAEREGAKALSDIELIAR